MLVSFFFFFNPSTPPLSLPTFNYNPPLQIPPPHPSTRLSWLKNPHTPPSSLEPNLPNAQQDHHQIITYLPLKPRTEAPSIRPITIS